MIEIFDRKLKKETLINYITQSFLAALMLYLGLRLPVLGEEIVLVAAVGSTAFVLFAMPHNKTAIPRRALGSHFACGLIGFAFSTLPSILSFELTVSLALGKFSRPLSRAGGFVASPGAGSDDLTTLREFYSLMKSASGMQPQ